MNKPPDVAAIRDSQDWAAIHLRLVEFARRRLRGNSVETAKEIAAEAIGRLWDPDYAAWDPAVQPDLLRHLGSVVNGIIRNVHASAANRTTVPTSAASGVAEAPLRGPGPAQAEAGDVERAVEAGRVVDRLLAHFEGKDPMLTQLLMLFVDGTDKAADQAAALGCAVPIVYAARRRFDAELAVVRAGLARREEP